MIACTHPVSSLYHYWLKDRLPSSHLHKPCTYSGSQRHLVSRHTDGLSVNTRQDSNINIFKIKRGLGRPISFCNLEHVTVVFVSVADYDYKFPLWVDLYVLLLAHVHSSINPIIYGFTNKHFRQGYLMVFERCGSSCARPESVRDTSTKVSSLTEGNSSMATDNVKADTSVKPDDSANA